MMRESDIKKMEEILSEFKRITPFIEEAPTIFEISGYPHFENVISNVLKYFLESKNGHNLSNAFLTALLSAAGENSIDEKFESIEVKREDPTSTGKRIDLVITADSICVAIENKIYAPLGNDLSDYRKHIKRKYSNYEPTFIVLAPERRYLNQLDDHGFKSVTYEEFFIELEKQIGKIITSIDSRHIVFLTEFIRTIRNFKRQTMATDEFIQFLSDNKKEIESLYEKAFVDFKEQLEKNADKIDQLIDEGSIRGFERKKYPKKHALEYVRIYEKEVFVESDSFTFQIKLRLMPKKYSIEYWSANGNKADLFRNYLKKVIGDELKHSPHKDDEENLSVVQHEGSLDEGNPYGIAKYVSEQLVRFRNH